MKKIVCEMCEGTEFAKADGMFVCQNCGTKYSPEEAKSLMVEVESTDIVVPTTAAPTVVTPSASDSSKIQNLLNLAHSSYDSKNYSQAEEFCNQVIAIDSMNYDAWKLKGEAINYQINASNPRILEVFNCIMTAYRVLDDAGKDEHRYELVDSIKTCFEGEIDFWLDQIEAQRPTDAAINKVKASFNDMVNKAKAAFIEFGYDVDIAEGYVVNLKNDFISSCNTKIVSTWKTTVGYNYYLNDLDRNSSTPKYNAAPYDIVWSDDEFRPAEQKRLTFTNECDNLIDLLTFAVRLANDETDPDDVFISYDNMIFLTRHAARAVSYKAMVRTTTNGYGAVTDRHEYWDLDKGLTEEAKDSREKNVKLWKAAQQEIYDKFVIDKTEEECLAKGMELISEDDGEKAICVYESTIKEFPDSPIAYIGKAVALALTSHTDNEVAKCIEMAATRTVDTSLKEFYDELIGLDIGSHKFSLLMYCCTESYLATEYLVKAGVDVNKKSTYGCTALWFVAHKSPSENKLILYRRIAQFLLDNGAECDVTNSGGVSLYNKDTDYEIERMILGKFPSLQKGEAAAKPSGGCYVATAVYGSYDCPEVWTLRRYRDNKLAETWYGRAFVKTYYAISPTLVKWFGHTKWFKKMWRGTLDRMVKNLQEEGFESTPYNDRKW